MYKFFGWLLLVILSLPLSGQDKVNYYFKQVGIEQGLSQSSVTSLMRDQRGVLWIGTRSGLNTLDRNELKSYFYDKNNKNSLPGNSIRHIVEDAEGNIWISGDRGLAVYKYEKDDFSPVTAEAVYSSVLVSDGIIFGGRKVLYKYNYRSKQIENIYFQGVEDFNISEEYDIIQLQKKDDRSILLGTREKGIFECDLASKQIKKMRGGFFPTILSMYVDEHNDIYVSSYKKGVYRLDSSGRLLDHYTSENSQLNNDIVLDITAKGGKIWMATDGGGINILDRKDRSFSIIQHIPGDPSSIPVNSITVLYHDRGENTWAGSVRGGVIGIKQVHINTYKDVAFGNTNGLTEKAVISLFEDKEGILWIGTDGGGINSYNPYTSQFKHFISTYGDKVFSITDLSENELLVSLYGKGVFSFNKKTETYKPFIIINDEVNDKECFAGFVPVVYRIADNKILILSQEAIIYDPQAHNFRYVKADRDKINLKSLFLVDTDKERSFLISRNQVYYIYQRDDSLRALFALPPQEIISSARLDKDGKLWIGSTRGLSYYDIQKDTLVRIETNLFRNISHLFLDENKKLWIGAQNMLFLYVIPEKRFIIWDESDGYASNEILFMYQTPSITKNIYLAGTNGLIKIEKDITYDDTSHPAIQLSDVLLNGKSYLNKTNNGSLSIPISYTSLVVKVNLNEKDVFRKTLFRYEIDGNNNLRIESYDNTLNLPALQSGRYLIRVSCNTKSGEWTKPVTVVSLSVTPPWYKTTSFLILSLLAGLLVTMYVLFSVFKKKERILKMRMQAYEQDVKEEKISFLINVSHELRTPLSLIYGPLKRILDKPENSTGNNIKAQLSSIFKQVSHMKDIVNMTLDVNMPEADRESVKKYPHSLNIWVKKVIEGFISEFEEKNIKIIFEPDDAIEQIWLDDAKTRIVLSNLLMNALKFSNPDTKVTVSTTLQNGKVRVSIADEGVGLQNLNMEKLFSRFYKGPHNINGSGIGLSYAKKLIEKQGGVIGAFDNEAGATFFFELPPQSGVEMKNVPEMEPNIDDINAMQHWSSSDFSLYPYTLIIVEDNSDFREYLKGALTGIFKNVWIASDGQEAIGMIEEKHPDIIVSDVMMPGMNGYELCRYVKGNIEISHIPVILLTARGDTESTFLGYKLGADSYLNKPFDINILIVIIKNILKSRETIKKKYKNILENIFPAELTFSNADEEFITNLKTLIEKNMSNPDMDVKFLIKNMAMSRASLYNKVKALTGMGVNDYVNKLKIERAIFLLLQSDYSISEVAYETGFSYQRHFSTIFKKITGMTPSEYRRENK